MKRELSQIVKVGALGVAALTSCAGEQSTAKQPNIIYILADDMGYGDLGCYGQQKVATPNIDRLASQGMLFTQHYAGTSVSAPSRSTLISGLHTGHTFIRGNKEMKGCEGQQPLPADYPTIFKMLKGEGYSTGVFGKWGLGYPGSEGDPNNQGVDDFYGYNCQRLAHNYYPYYLWDNQTRVVLEGNEGAKEEEYAPYLIHDQVMEFMDENKDNPFFIYYAAIAPHAEMIAPEPEMEKSRGKYLPEKKYKGTEPGDKSYKDGGYCTQEECHAAFVAMITILDAHVGEVVRKVEELGLADNTIIIFASDNGPSNEGGSDPNYFDCNGELRGYKRDLYEGGIRVPMVARWDGKIEAGSKSDHVSAFWDILPTVAEVIGVEVEREIDGISMLPTLLGQAGQQEHDYLYWEFHENKGRKAVRMGDWKGVIYNITRPNSKIELYNLSTDIGETTDVAAQNPEIVAQIAEIMKSARTESELFNFGSVTYSGDKK